MELRNYIKPVTDFPKPGVLFRDITPLLQDSAALDYAAQEMAALTDISAINAFVGIEARGFILAAYMAGKFRKGFIPLRKAGKLPPPVLKKSYELEYATATLEISENAKKVSGGVVIVDDVIATGGTLQAAIGLCEQAGFNICDVIVLINISKLNQFSFNNQPIKSLITY